MLEEIPNCFATSQLIAIATCLKSLRLGAFADFAFVAMSKLYTFFATAGAVNHFGGYSGIKLGAPGNSGFCTKKVVVIQGGGAGIASGAVYSAASNYFFHIDKLFWG
jgi:hypothetical protein